MPEQWRVTCIARRYEWLKTEDGFACLVALGRCLNQIRLSVYVLQRDDDPVDSPPFRARQSTSALLLLAAALYEGIYLAQHHLGRHFRAREEFAVIRSFWRDKNKRQFFEDRVLPLRNKAVSHFDPDETKRLFKTLTVTDACVFAEGLSDYSRDLHYQLSDGIATMTFAGDCDSFDELKERSDALVIALATFASEFMHAGDALIGAALRDWGFVSEDIPETATQTAPVGKQ